MRRVELKGPAGDDGLAGRHYEVEPSPRLADELNLASGQQVRLVGRRLRVFPLDKAGVRA